MKTYIAILTIKFSPAGKDVNDKYFIGNVYVIGYYK